MNDATLSNGDFERVDKLPEVRNGIVSRSAVYRAAKTGAIPSCRIGRHLFVVRHFLVYLAKEQGRK